jgi:hypothetical protein
MDELDMLKEVLATPGPSSDTVRNCWANAAGALRNTTGWPPSGSGQAITELSLQIWVCHLA